MKTADNNLGNPEKNKWKLNRESEARHREMVQSSIPLLVTKLSVPTVITQMITVVYNTADTYFVSQIHTSAAAAVGVVFSLMSIIHALGFSIGMGTGSLISMSLGAKANEKAHMYGISAVCEAFVMGSLLTVFGLLFLEPLMILLGSSKTVLPYSMSYAYYILMGSPVMCTTFVLNNILRQQGKTQIAMWGICSGGLINCLLDPLFIFTLKMGIQGAAAATVISQIFSFLILLAFFLLHRSIVVLDWRKISLQPHIYWLIFSCGVPTFFRQSMGSVSSALLNIMASGYGDAALAAITIANKVYMLVRSLVMGIGQGMQPAVGYNFGADCYSRVKKIFWFGTALGTALCCAAAFLLAVFSAETISWFRPDPEVIRIGRRALLAGCAVMPFMAYSTYVNQVSQVLGFRLEATVLASCRQGIFFLPAAFLLNHFIGLWGLTSIQPTADLCTFMVSVPYQIFFFRHHLSKTEKNKTF